MDKKNPRLLQRDLYLLLLPLFYVLHGFAEHFGMIRAVDAAWLLCTYLLSSALLTALAYLLYRSFRKAALLATLLLSVHFFFGALHDGLKELVPGSLFTRYSFLLPFLLLVVLLLGRWLLRTRHTFDRLAAYLNLLLLALILIDGVQLTNRVQEARKAAAAPLPSGLQPCDTCSKPDIYFILADEYAGRQALQDLFGFDNRPFEDSLRNRGFQVFEESHGNYNFTPFCLASTFHMNYLEAIEGKNSSRHDRRYTYRKLGANPVAAFLRKQGYVVRNFSIFPFDHQPPIIKSAVFIRAGIFLITNHTLVERINRDMGFHLITTLGLESARKNMAMKELERTRSLYQATLLEAERQRSQPRFVYTHLMMPHFPYYYNRQGQLNPLDMLASPDGSDKKAYIEYLQYANGQLLQLIDHIRRNASRPTVIMLMSDHGFRHSKEPVDPRYQFMTFNAILLPQGQQVPLPKSMAAVNHFRWFFNQQFNQQLPMLKDSTSLLKE